ncbi:hypothetical protein Pla123a_01740 [Posidoniimonas polymericola]|uniref:Ice-binding protein C-terminal domain-containing protein n=1 Tax=Posidoniimonas polymericola TaxID=2528002 RepID=A0A5C5ZE72_9BACT|nr:PEP-CTERM sorting domain-containing protein [Posidoniimonas polymericola]TWT85367.1 hypothetical protein Pla123a_01740 [Posidoniimonas polymericola]
MKQLCLITAAMLTASIAHAALLDSTFTNLDFDASTQAHFPDGWDSATYDIPGWQNATAITDGGIEFEGAWWGPLQEYSAFVKSGEGLYNLSSYVIQSGDVFDISTFAKRWNSNDAPEMVVTLFHGADASTNVIGSFNTGVLTDAWTEYGGTIAATAASVGQTLGVRVDGAGTWFTNFDELSISTVPEPTSLGVLGLGGLALACVRRRTAC